ncbi:hypothetical protein WG66_007860 [Moniliophthora roreri]|nr:hypothetical protein WG66_007860 [Moniliophthora roreri]
MKKITEITQIFRSEKERKATSNATPSSSVQRVSLWRRLFPIHRRHPNKSNSITVAVEFPSTEHPYKADFEHITLTPEPTSSLPVRALDRAPDPLHDFDYTPYHPDHSTPRCTPCCRNSRHPVIPVAVPQGVYPCCIPLPTHYSTHPNPYRSRYDYHTSSKAYYQYPHTTQWFAPPHGQLQIPREVRPHWEQDHRQDPYSAPHTSFLPRPRASMWRRSYDRRYLSNRRGGFDIPEMTASEVSLQAQAFLPRSDLQPLIRPAEGESLIPPPVSRVELSSFDSTCDPLRSQPLTFQGINHTQKNQGLHLPLPHQPSPSATPEILRLFVQAKICEECYTLIFTPSVKVALSKLEHFIPYLEEGFDGEKTLHLIPVPRQMKETLRIIQWLPEECEFHLTRSSTTSTSTCQTHGFAELGTWQLDVFSNGHMVYHGLRSNNTPRGWEILRSISVLESEVVRKKTRKLKRMQTDYNGYPVLPSVTPSTSQTCSPSSSVATFNSPVRDKDNLEGHFAESETAPTELSEELVHFHALNSKDAPAPLPKLDLVNPQILRKESPLSDDWVPTVPNIPEPEDVRLEWPVDGSLTPSAERFYASPSIPSPAPTRIIPPESHPLPGDEHPKPKNSKSARKPLSRHTQSFRELEGEATPDKPCECTHITSPGLPMNASGP